MNTTTTKPRGLILDAERVRKLLAGETVRVEKRMNPQPIDREDTAWWHPDGGFFFVDEDTKTRGRVHDFPFPPTVYVRETYTIETNFNLDSEENYPPPFGDAHPIRRKSHPDLDEWWLQPHYKATDPKPELVNNSTDAPVGWRSPATMPRWASRLNAVRTHADAEQREDGWYAVAEYRREY